nr:hypothetical protein [Tanacetum cinerariifolium]
MGGFHDYNWESSNVMWRANTKEYIYWAVTALSGIVVNFPKGHFVFEEFLSTPSGISLLVVILGVLHQASKEKEMTDYFRITCSSIRKKSSSKIPNENMSLKDLHTTTPRTAPAALANQNLSTPNDVDELPQQQHVQQQDNQAPLQLETIYDNVLSAMFDGDIFENPFAPPSTSAAESSSLQYVDPSNMDTFYKSNDLDSMSLDDLYNHLKVYEDEVQKKPNSNSQNMAFISSSKNNNNEDGNTVCVTTATTAFPTGSVNVAKISQDTTSAFIASQSNGSQIKFEDINQIDEDDMEEIDIKWNMALLSMRADKF